jgi:tetratricopeptide (TPR) repeat protein
VLALATAATAQSSVFLAAAHDHYFNLEYDEAIRCYYQALEADGEDASLWNHIATAILYQELNRLGKLESSAFRGDNAFLGEEKPQPDPEAAKRFLGALHQARKLAEQQLAENPKSGDALFALSANYGLEANYEFMIEKSYFSALRNGNRARKYAEQLIELQPDYVDAYLVPGVQEYVLGSLPWVVKMFAAIGGISGDKQKGEAWVQRVADEGDQMKIEAKVLMTLLHRREHRPLEAAKVLEELIAAYPRNYVLRFELGGMYLDAGRQEQALDVFETSKRMVDRDEQRFARMPDRLKQALERRIESLKQEIAATGAQESE